MSDTSRAAAVLERWRECERRFNEATLPAEREVARAEMQILRDEYQDVVRQAAAATPLSRILSRS